MDTVSSRFTNSRSLRRIRLRSVAVPFFLVTVKPIRTGPSSSLTRFWTTKAALLIRAPLATARKSARCLNRSMMKSLEARSGAQTLTASRAARGENLAAAGGRKPGAKAVTALAHQFARLISPLHGPFSADRAISPDIEMKSDDAGPNQ